MRLGRFRAIPRRLHNRLPAHAAVRAQMPRLSFWQERAVLFCFPGWKQSTTLLSPNRRPADPPFDRLSAPLCPRPCRPIRQLRWGADASAAERARRGRHKTTFARPSGRVPTHRSRPAPLRRQASGRLNRTMPPPRPVDCFSAIPPSLPPSLPPPPPPPQHLEQPHRLADPARHPVKHPGPGPAAAAATTVAHHPWQQQHATPSARLVTGFPVTGAGRDQCAYRQSRDRRAS